MMQLYSKKSSDVRMQPKKETIQFLGINHDVNKIEVNLQYNPFTIPRNDFSKKLIQTQLIP